MSDILNNVPDFKAGTTPTAEAFNALRNAVINLFAGQIPSDAMIWPFVAEGDIDMDGYSLLNSATIDNTITVNDVYSLSDAVSKVNDNHGGTILIDSGVTASISAEGLVVTADNVLIVGNDAAITVDANAPYGLRIVGNNFKINGPKILQEVEGNLPFVFEVLGDNASFKNMVFGGGDTIFFQIGSGTFTPTNTIIDRILLDTPVAGAIFAELTAAEIIVINNVHMASGASAVMLSLTGISGVNKATVTNVSMTGGTATTLLDSPPIAGGSNSAWHMKNIYVYEITPEPFSPGSVHYSLFEDIHFEVGVDLVLCGNANRFVSVRNLGGTTLWDYALQTSAFGCYLVGAMTWDTSVGLCVLESSRVTGDVGYMATGEMRLFAGNYVSGDLSGMPNVTAYHSNVVAGTET